MPAPSSASEGSARRAPSSPSAPRWAPSSSGGAPKAAAPSAAPPAADHAEPSAGSAARKRGGAYAERETRDERPGLGTTWGENRSSPVSSAPFERASGDNPFSTLAVNYNDESGLHALAQRMGDDFGGYDSAAFSAGRGNLTVRVLDEGGSPLPSVRIAGRDYVLGNDGARYVIQIENHSANRYEAVGTVDGLDVIDGRPGSFHKRGYLVGPWASVEIDGFRRSTSTVAAFRFGAVKDSYAARRGDDRNVGVIGVAFFEERGANSAWTVRELERRQQADPFPGRFAPPPPPRQPLLDPER